jgi:hypothetical protein
MVLIDHRRNARLVLSRQRCVDFYMLYTGRRRSSYVIMLLCRHPFKLDEAFIRVVVELLARGETTVTHTTRALSLPVAV